MTVRLRPGAVSGRLRAPGSKAHTHRAFILAALAGNGSVQNALSSEDTEATLRCLERLGFLVTHLPHETRVGGTFRAPREALDVRESGTTLRLLSAVSTLQPAEVRFRAGPVLSRRPMRPLLDALRDLGVSVPGDDGHPPFSLRGPLRGGPTRIPGDVSSQFLSALLLACPVAPGRSQIAVEGPITSRPYVDLTLAQLRHHGVRVEEEKGTFVVPGGQRVRQRPYRVPGDYSSAAFFLAAAAVTGGSVTVENLSLDDPQGDRAIVDHLRAFGATADPNGDAVTVRGGPLRGAELDVGRVPDLFPVLCALGAVATGRTRLHGAPHLRAKESDRIHAMAVNLAAAGIRARELPDGIEIEGGRPRGVEIQSFGDHRVAMAMCVLALAADGESVLPDEGVVAKSYPSFLIDLDRIAPEVAAP